MSSTKDICSLFWHDKFLPITVSQKLSFGEERSKVIKVKEKFTVIFKEIKQDCLLQQKLFVIKKKFPVYAKLYFTKIMFILTSAVEDENV